MVDDKQNNNKQPKQKNGEVRAHEQPQQQAAQEPQEYKDIREQMLRLAAEFDNYKKRTKSDIDGAKGVGKAEIVRKLLPIIDEFELALMAVSKSDDKSMARGIELLYSNLMDALKKDGLQEVDCDGTFDPYRHEIVMAVESGKKNGTILEVVKKGYTLGNVLLRPASVIVAKEQPVQTKEQQK